MLIRRGDLGRHVYVILAGEVDVHRDGSDGPRHVRTLDQHAFIGEIAVLDDVSRTATVTAKSTLDVLEIDREVLLRMMSDEPKLADAVEHHRAGTDFLPDRLIGRGRSPSAASGARVSAIVRSRARLG